MDENVKAALSELARAINEGLERSSRVGESIRKLEELGYKFALYLEATILLTKEEGERRKGRRAPRRARLGALRLSDQDLKFLKSLKIALDDKDG